MAEIKENDFFVSKILNPDLGSSNFQEMGLTADNTQFKDKAYYKSKSFVQDTFKNDKGVFDEDAFNKVYDNVLNDYQGFSQGKQDDLDRLEYAYSNAFRPSKSNIYNAKFEINKIKNPFRLRFGMNGIGSVDESHLSLSEIAQQQQIFDSKTGKFLDLTPNDSGFLGLKGFFRDPLVLAQWDEDGEHLDEETGRMVSHSKGEYRTNSNGDYYYETLGDRDIAGKQVLSGFDTLTEDGSVWNKYDIFDNDNKEQNVGKTILRNALKFAPIAAGALSGAGTVAAGVATAYLGATALFNLTSALPSLYKGIEGIATNNEDYSKRSALWKMMNQLAARTSTMTPGVSDYSKAKVFTWENTINMIGDVGLQLGQQRWVAEIPSKLGLESMWINKAASRGEQGRQYVKFTEFQKNLATAYMTLTSGADSYNSAIEAGHSERTAGLVMLGTLGGLHQIMKSDIGQWPLKGIGLDDVRMQSKDVLTGEAGILNNKAFKELFKKAEQTAVSETAGAVTDKAKQTVMKTVSDAIKNRVGGFIDNPSTFMGAAVSEAFEEVSEELTQDFVMGIAKAAEVMGVTRKTEWSFADTNPFERYLMSAFGGAVGGGLHNINFKNGWTSAHKVAESGESDGNAKLLNLAYKYGADAIIDEINRLYNKGELAGDRNLSATPIFDGKENRFVTANEETETQAYAVKEGLVNLVRTYDRILSETGSDGFDLDVARALNINKSPELQKLADYGLTDVVGGQLGFYNKKIVDTMAEIEDITQKGGDPTDAQSRLLEYRNEKTKILQGEKFDDYFQQGILHLNKDLANAFFNVDIHDFSIAKYGKSYEELSDYEKDLAKTQYSDYKDNVLNFGYDGAMKIIDSGLNRLGHFAEKYGKEYLAARKASLQNASKLFKDSQTRLDIFQKESGLIDSSKLDKFNDIETEGGTKIKANKEMVDLGYEGFHDLDVNQGVNVDPETGAEVTLNDRKVIIYNNMLEALRGIKSMNLDIDQALANEVTKQNNKIKSTVEEKSKKVAWGELPLDVIPSLAPMFTTENILSGKTAELIKDFTKEDFQSILSTIPDTEIDGFYEDVDLDRASDKDGTKLFNAAKKNLEFRNNRILKTLNSELAPDINFYNQSTELINQTVKSPLDEYLEEVTKMTSNNSTHVFDLLKSENVRFNANKATEYFATNPDAIDRAKQDIEIAKKLLEMSLGLEGSGNYVSIVNHYRNKYAKDKELFKSIDPETGIMMMAELQGVEDKLNFFSELSKYNSADKLKEHKNSAGGFYSLFADLYQPVNGVDKPLIDEISDNLGVKLNEGISEIIGQNMEAWQSILNIKNQLDKGESISNEDLAKAELLITLVEDKLFENTQAALRSGTTTIQNIAKALTHPSTFKKDYASKSSIVNAGTSEIHSRTQKLEDYDKLMYFTTVMGSKSSTYKHHLADVLTETNEDGSPKFELAPIFAQEYPCRMAYAYTSNPYLFNEVLSNLTAPDQKGDEYHKYPYLNNILYINGYHGTGKTSATARISYEILKRVIGEDNLTLSSIKPRQVTKLASSLKVDKKGYDKPNVLKMILGDKQLTDVISNNNVNYDAIKALGDNINIGQVLFIDETTHYSLNELKLLTTWASINNKTVLAFGDNLQMGSQDKDISYALVAKTPTLEFSMRSGSSVVKDNSDQYRKLTNNINKNHADPKTHSEITDEFNKTIMNPNGTFDLKYYQNNDGTFQGLKLAKEDVFTEEYISNHIRSVMKGSVTNEDIAIIYGNENQSNFPMLQNIANSFNIPMLKYNDMQGSEFEHVIISTDKLNVSNASSPDLIVEYVKLANTLFSRAVSSTLVHDTGLNLRNERAKHDSPTKLDSKAVEEFKNIRLESLENIKTNIPLEETKPVSETTKGEEESGPKPVQPQPSLNSEAEVQGAIVSAVSEGKQLPTSQKGESSVSETIEEIKNNKENPDGKVLGFTNVNVFGFTVGKDGEGKSTFNFHRTNDIGLTSDLMCFAEFDDEDNATFNSGNFTREMCKDFDRLRKSILKDRMKIESGETSIYDVFGKFSFGNNPNSIKPFGKGSFKMIVKKYNEDFDKNHERPAFGKGFKPPKLQTALVYMSEDGKSYITLALMGEKTQNDKYFSNVINTSQKLIDKGDKYVVWHVPANIITDSGSETRLFNKEDTMVSLEDYSSLDLSYANYSEPMIITGYAPEINKLKQLDGDADGSKLRTILREISDKYEGSNINGRPVVFVTKNPDLNNLTSEELAMRFYDQKVEQHNYEKFGKPLSRKPDVSMVVLENAKYASVNDYLNKLDSIIKSNDPNLEKGKAIRMIAHEFVGLNMLKSIYDTKFAMSEKFKTLTPQEKNVYYNLATMIKIIETKFPIKGVKIDGNVEIVNSNNNVINPENINDLKEIYQNTNKDDRSEKLLDDYYKNFVGEENQFRFSNIVFFLNKLTKTDTQLLFDSLKIENTTNLSKRYDQFADSLNYAMVGKGAIGNTILENNFVKKKFPNGFDIHPIYFSQANTNTFDIANWCHLCRNPKSDFFLKNVMVEGQRYLIDYSKLQTEKSFNEEKKTKADEFLEKQNNISKSISELDINENVKADALKIVSDMKQENVEISLDKLDSFLKSKKVNEINKPGMTNDPIIEFIVTDDGVIPQNLSDYNEVDGKKIVEFDPSSTNLTFKDEDGNSYEINPVTKKIQQIGKGINLDSDDIMKFEENTLRFLNKIEGINSLLVPELTNILAVNPDQKVTVNFNSVLLAVNNLLQIDEDDKLVQEFEELLSDKLDIIC